MKGIYHKIQYLKFLLCFLIILFFVSLYFSYKENVINYFHANFPSKIVLQSNNQDIYVNDSIKLNIIFSNIPDFYSDRAKIEYYLKSICPNLKFIDYNLSKAFTQDAFGTKYFSFTLSAKYKVIKPTEDIYPLNNIYYENNQKEKFYLEGSLPQFKELSSYSFLVPNSISEGADFYVTLILANVPPQTPIPNLFIDNNIKEQIPKVIGNPEIKISDGIRNLKNIQIKQKYEALTNGIFTIEASKILLPDKSLEIKKEFIHVNEGNKTFNVVVDSPRRLNQKFSIIVELDNVKLNNPAPEFPIINKCQKVSLTKDVSKASGIFYRMTFKQAYETISEGYPQPKPLKIWLGQEIKEYNLPQFSIVFDCSSPDLERPLTGFIPFKLGKSNGLERNIELKNTTNVDVVVKLVNNHYKNAVRSIYIRSNDTGAIYGLSSGTYFIAVAYGRHWNIKTNKFRCDESFTVFDNASNLIAFKNNQLGTWTSSLSREYSQYSDASSGNAVGELSFEKY
jgi:hypothetical protein